MSENVDRVMAKLAQTSAKLGEEIDKLFCTTLILLGDEPGAATLNPHSLAAAEARLEELDAAKEPLSLSAVQRRQKEWAERNFPLKVTDEHRRVAKEFLQNWTGYRAELDDLAYLLASRESRNHRPLLGACEELGELCHAHLKNEQGIRGTPEEWEAKKKDAIGDVLIYLMDYANREGLDMEECLELALEEISTRDWQRYPLDGRTK